MKPAVKRFLSINKGFLIFMFAILFRIAESLYFGQGTLRGFNQSAESRGELICDGIATILVVLGIFQMVLTITWESNNKKMFVYPGTEEEIIKLDETEDQDDPHIKNFTQ